MSNFSLPTYRSVDPVTLKEGDREFTFTSPERISAVVDAAKIAHRELLRVPSEKISEFLSTLADNLLSVKPSLLEVCARETGLPIATRLDGELLRTASVLNIFAEQVRQREVADLRISPAKTNTTPQRPDVRRRSVGVGPVVVLEASNFPLAFGVVGGDTASSWAAGCPVVAKIHPFHPETSELIGQVVQRTITSCGLPQGMFALIHGGEDEVRQLVTHPEVRGVAFTGSRGVGKIIRRLANSRDIPLSELSLEMGSVNPSFIFSGALQERGETIAKDLAAATLIGGGQYCTNPGVVFVSESVETEKFLQSLRSAFVAAETPVLLSLRIAQSYSQGIERLSQIPGITSTVSEKAVPAIGAFVAPTLLETSLETYLANPILSEEVFGPSTLVVRAAENDFVRIARLSSGELTGSVHCAASDHEKVGELIRELESKVGRIIFNGYPPGVPLCDAVNHGGPWPSALGRSTVVGPSSFERWTRPISYQGFPGEFLPQDLKSSGSSTGLKRVDGKIVVG